MPSRQHHYVPRFYLKRFSKDPKCINIYNIRRRLSKRNVSLRHQCSKPNFYRDQNIEDALSRMEAQAALACNTLTNQESSDMPKAILEFIATQHLRTPAQAKVREAMQRKFLELTTQSDETSEALRETLGIIAPDLMPVYNLLMLDDVVEAIEDLKFLVLNADVDVFITSDNPVFKYNQYCQGVQNFGTTGAGQTGLQIFLPLSPRHQLVLYDGKVYDYVKSRTPNTKDIDMINSLQVVSAEDNLYFSDWNLLERIESLVSSETLHGADDSTVLEEFNSDEEENESLLHFYTETPNLGMDLSFLQIKRRALRVPLRKRMNSLRQQNAGSNRRGRGGQSKTYSTLAARI